MKSILTGVFIVVFSAISVAQTDTSSTEEFVPESADIETTESISDFRPIVSLSGGWLTFFGDVSNKQKANGILLSNLAVDLSVSFPLKSSFYLTFRSMLGTVSANERSASRNLNFSSRIQTFGIETSYNFNHFLNEKRAIDPYLSIGFDALVFNSKTDLFDANGNQYYYWTSGDIMDRAETPENLASANKLQRDYDYETDLRKSGVTGAPEFDKFSFVIPFGAGVNMRLSHKFHVHIGATYNVLLTDRVDGVTADGVADYNGSGKLDGFLFSHIGLSYDLSNHSTSNPEEGGISDEELADLATGDKDLDGVNNLADECSETPAGVEVDEKGCPFDEDKDGVPDYLDLELGTDSTLIVDTNGVGMTQEQIQMIALRFLDESGALTAIEDTIYTNELPSKTERITKKKYSVQVASDSLSTEQAVDLLSNEKLKSVQDGDNSTVLVGEFDEISEALAKNKELKEKGISTRAIVEETVTGKIIIADTRGEIVGATIGKTAPPGTQFRIQVGAFKKPIKKGAFSNLNIIGIKSSDGFTRYYISEGYSSYDAAAAAKVALKGQGIGNSLIKAFSEGEQVSLSSAGATFDATNTNPASPKDKSKVSFKVQLGAYANAIPMAEFNKFVKLGKIANEKGSDGKTRYFVGSFSSYDQASSYINELGDFNINEAFVVGEYNGKTISAKEAMDIVE